MYAVHCIMNIVQCIVYAVQSMPNCVLCTMDGVWCTVYTVHLYNVCALCTRTLFYTMNIVLLIVFCVYHVYTIVYTIVYTVQCTVYMTGDYISQILVTLRLVCEGGDDII